MPIFINPPAKIKKQTIIHTILTDMDVVATGELEEWEGSSPVWDASNQHQTYVIVSEENYHAKVADNGIQLLGSDLASTDASGNPLSWATVLKAYGELSAGISQLRFRNTTDPADSSADILGTISFFHNGITLSTVSFKHSPLGNSFFCKS